MPDSGHGNPRPGSSAAGVTPAPRLVALSDHGFTDSAAVNLAALIALASGARTAMIHLRAGPELRLVGIAEPPPGWKEQAPAAASRTLAGWIAEHGHPLIINDLLTDPRVPPDAPARDVGIRCYAGFPIRDSDTDIVGTCAVMDYQPRDWTVAALSGVAAGAETCTAIAAEHRGRVEAGKQRRFRDALLSSLHSGVLAVDADGRVMFTNPAMHTLCAGLAGGENLAAWAGEHGSISDWLSGTAPAAAAPLLRALTGEDVAETELTLPGVDGRPRVLLADAEPITGQDGHRLGAVLVARDVTEQRRGERYARAEAAVSAVLADAPTVEEAAYRLLEALCTSLGWPYAEMWLVQPAPDRLVPAAQHAVAGLVRALPVPAALSRGSGLAGSAWAADAPVWTGLSGGELIPSHLIEACGLRTGLAVPIPVSGQTQAIICLFSDRLLAEPERFTERSATLSAHIGQYLHRRRAEEAELALARTKDEYLALIGHEMRTPLTTIVSYTELALDDPDPDPATTRQLLQAVDRNAARLRRIIDELLDLAAFDAGDGVHPDQAVDLGLLTAAAADDVRAQIAAAELTLETRLADGCAVVGDGDRLRQVLDHLIENAVLNTPAGGTVTLTLHRGETDVRLAVADTGVGIPDAERGDVFERFYRTTYSREHNIPGAGLGLAISRAIIEYHGGTLTLTPERLPTEMVICLPARP